MRLGKVVELVNGRAFKPTEWSSSGLRIVRIQNLNDPSAPFNYADFEVEDKFHIDSGDLLVSWSGTPGTSFGAFIWDNGAAVLNQHIFRTEYDQEALVPRFLQLAIDRLMFELIGEAVGGVGLRHVRKGQIEACCFGIPPLAEQTRIVAKVDQLMALCDELEAKKNQRAETHGHLIRAAHQPLTQPRDHAEFRTAWQRIFDNFDGLHTTIDSIKALRQTILQLAVQGKLVPQDPSDEPASLLLEKSRAEKARLVAEGKIKKGKALPVVDPGAVPYGLPKGWQWVPLGDLGSWKGGGTPSKQNLAYWSGDIPWVSPKDMKQDEIHDAQDHISDVALQETTVKEIEAFSLLVVVRGMILAHSFPTAINQRVVTINQDMKALELFLNSIGPFVQLSLKAEKFRILGMVERSTHGTCRLGSDDLASFPVATPPVVEQHRIVAKVDDLMILCDGLETKIEANQNTAQQFAEAVVAELAA